MSLCGALPFILLLLSHFDTLLYMAVLLVLYISLLLIAISSKGAMYFPNTSSICFSWIFLSYHSLLFTAVAGRVVPNIIYTSTAINVAYNVWLLWCKLHIGRFVICVFYL